MLILLFSSATATGVSSPAAATLQRTAPAAVSRNAAATLKVVGGVLTIPSAASLKVVPPSKTIPAQAVLAKSIGRFLVASARLALTPQTVTSTAFGSLSKTITTTRPSSATLTGQLTFQHQFSDAAATLNNPGLPNTATLTFRATTTLAAAVTYGRATLTSSATASLLGPGVQNRSQQTIASAALLLNATTGQTHPTIPAAALLLNATSTTGNRITLTSTSAATIIPISNRITLAQNSAGVLVALAGLTRTSAATLAAKPVFSLNAAGRLSGASARSLDAKATLYTPALTLTLNAAAALISIVPVQMTVAVPARAYLRGLTTAQPGTPGAQRRGDIVRAVGNVILQRFDQTGSSKNLCPDSPMNYVGGPTPLVSMWDMRGVGATLAIGGGVGGGNAIRTPGPGLYGYSRYFDVMPGWQLTVSGWINSSAATSGSAYWMVVADGAAGVILAQASLPAGSINRTAITFTVPAGVFRCKAAYDSRDCNGPVNFAQPMVQRSTSVSRYAANAAAPDIQGLPSEVVTTLETTGEQYQDVHFQSIEPDWNAAMSERANAVSTALIANTVSNTTPDSYAVSVQAYTNVTYLTNPPRVSVPAFQAIFGPGTPIITIQPKIVTLIANKTNWVWFNNANTWLVLQDPSPQSGSILYGIFTCDATSVVGYIYKASITVFQIGVGNVNVGNHLPPLILTPQVPLAIGPEPTTMFSDVLATAALDTSNVQDGSVGGVAFYFKVHSESTWTPWADVPLKLTTAGLPVNPQTVSFEYAQLNNGVIYDFGIMYAGIANADYGSPNQLPTQIGSPDQVANGFLARNMVVSTPYLMGGQRFAPITALSTTIGAPAGQYTQEARSANGLASALSLWWRITNQPTDGSLSRIHILYRQASDPADSWTEAAGVPAKGVSLPLGQLPTWGEYAITLTDLAQGNTYIFACKFEDARGEESDAGQIGIPVKINPPVVDGRHLGTMPEYIRIRGPYVATDSPSPSPTPSGASFSFAYGFVTQDWPGQAPSIAATWLQFVKTYVRVSSTNLPIESQHFGPTLDASNHYTDTVNGLGHNQIYDFGVSYVDHAGQTSTINWTFRNITMGDSPGDGNVNLIPDSSFFNTNFRNLTGIYATSTAYWTMGTQPGPAWNSQFTGIGEANGPHGSNALAATRLGGVDLAIVYMYSQPIKVFSGTTYTASAWIFWGASDAEPAPFIGIYDEGLATLLAAKAQVPTPGAAVISSALRVQVQWTATFNGYVRIYLTTNGSTPGGAVFGTQIAEPQFEIGTFMSPYKPTVGGATSGADAGGTTLAGGPSHVRKLLSAGGKDGTLTSPSYNLVNNGGFEVTVLTNYGPGINTNPPDQMNRIPGWFYGGDPDPSGDSAYVEAQYYSEPGQYGIERSGPGRLRVERPYNSLPGWTAVGQRFTVAASGSYAYRFWWNVTNSKQSHVKIIFYKSDGTALISSGTAASTSGTAVSGDGAAPPGNTYFLIGGTDGSTNNWQPVQGVFIAPADAAWADVWLMAGWSFNATTQSYNVFDQIMIVPGTIPAVYGAREVDHGALPTTVQSIITPRPGGGGEIRHSTGLVSQGSINPMVSSGWFTCTSNGAGLFTFQMASGSYTTILMPDGSSRNVFDSPISVSVSTLSTYHYSVYAAASTNYSVVYIVTDDALSKTAYDNTIFPAFADGALFLAKDRVCPSPSTPGTTGGGTERGCPAVGQEMWMRKRGVIEYAPCELLEVGDSVLDPDGTWNEVSMVSRRPARIYSVTFDEETIRVDASHRFLNHDKDWVDVRHMIAGTVLIRYPDGEDLVVRSVTDCGDGEMIALHCANFRYVLGKTVSHNIKLF